MNYLGPTPDPSKSIDGSSKTEDGTSDFRNEKDRAY